LRAKYYFVPVATHGYLSSKNNNFGLKQLQTARVAVGGVVPN
jgi:hypothetical protein